MASTWSAPPTVGPAPSRLTDWADGTTFWSERELSDQTVDSSSPPDSRGLRHEYWVSCHLLVKSVNADLGNLLPMTCFNSPIQKISFKQFALPPPSTAIFPCEPPTNPNGGSFGSCLCGGNEKRYPSETEKDKITSCCDQLPKSLKTEASPYNVSIFPPFIFFD